MRTEPLRNLEKSLNQLEITPAEFRFELERLVGRGHAEPELLIRTAAAHYVDDTLSYDELKRTMMTYDERLQRSIGSVQPTAEDAALGAWYTVLALGQQPLRLVSLGIGCSAAFCSSNSAYASSAFYFDHDSASPNVSIALHLRTDLGLAGQIRRDAYNILGPRLNVPYDQNPVWEIRASDALKRVLRCTTNWPNT